MISGAFPKAILHRIADSFSRIANISTAAAYLLYFRILAIVGATNVLLVMFLIPSSALWLGVGVLGEAVNALEYIGMGCILLWLNVIEGRVRQWVMFGLN
ncbi:hypothetical protein JY97_12695 [Alkalispirochaeta odontotermitis]|nr:hypothetical protein JY97_12695 [Alkalispirochaeta odontotermitis]CAB1068289.1 Permease of the drug/metabolite transporter (DMT) superfamily [Olavius algarvensis Delta 1 endosymbiont]